MFESSPSSSSSQGVERFLYDFGRHYKIWFSQYPDIFLGMENQLRLIRMRKNYPEAFLSFIYSESCLSPKALEELHQFCKRYNIMPISLESVEGMLQEPRDKTLYQLARREIANCINRCGGNMAAASDCVRLLLPVIVKFGVYSDCDKDSQLSKLGSPFLNLPCPVLLSTEMSLAPMTSVALSPNSDFLAFGLDLNNPEQLSESSKICLINLQDTIIANYQRPFEWNTLSPGNRISDLKIYPILTTLFQEFEQRYPDHPDIFQFRSWVSSLPDEPYTQGNSMPVKIFLERLAVINISGPGCYTSLFKHLVPKEYKNIPLSIPAISAKWQPFLALFERCGIQYYQPIYSLINNSNTMKETRERMRAGKTESGCDFSWTERGINSSRDRDQALCSAASAITGYWRHRLFWRNHFIHSTLPKQAAKVCTDESLLAAIRAGDYSLALRKACAGQHLEVVRLLIDCKIKRGIDFNVNQTSSTVTKTALDWAINPVPGVKVVPAEQQALIELLRKADAKRAGELAAVCSASISPL